MTYWFSSQRFDVPISALHKLIEKAFVGGTCNGPCWSRPARLASAAKSFTNCQASIARSCTYISLLIHALIVSIVLSKNSLVLDPKALIAGSGHQSTCMDGSWSGHRSTCQWCWHSHQHVYGKQGSIPTRWVVCHAVKSGCLYHSNSHKLVVPREHSRILMMIPFFQDASLCVFPIALHHMIVQFLKVIACLYMKWVSMIQ